MERKPKPCWRSEKRGGGAAARWRGRRLSVSFAVVKRSEDPYKDFKSSMVDMILEKQMFDPAELEQLLQCFLSLNSSQYHALIVH